MLHIQILKLNISWYSYNHRTKTTGLIEDNCKEWCRLQRQDVVAACHDGQVPQENTAFSRVQSYTLYGHQTIKL